MLRSVQAKEASAACCVLSTGEGGYAATCRSGFTAVGVQAKEAALLHAAVWGCRRRRPRRCMLRKVCRCRRLR
jgi:hypothetical protein